MAPSQELCELRGISPLVQEAFFRELGVMAFMNLNKSQTFQNDDTFELPKPLQSRKPSISEHFRPSSIHDPFKDSLTFGGNTFH